MPRGNAPDRIDDHHAGQIIEAWKKARKALGLTDQMIADCMHCDRRVVTNALTPGRPLRIGTAAAILAVLEDARQARGQLTDPPVSLYPPAAAKYFRIERYPAAIIPKHSINPLAKYLAEEAATASGIGSRSRAAVERALRISLAKSIENFALSFHGRFAQGLIRKGGQSPDDAWARAHSLSSELRLIGFLPEPDLKASFDRGNNWYRQPALRNAKPPGREKRRIAKK